tara:strand:+ start:709 stop:1035 length:327 start_codon:yes stop_codon:yes gene_type:complete
MITKDELEKAKQHLGSLSDNWYHDEEKHYCETYGAWHPEDIPTNLLMPHNYKDLRFLEDFFKKLTLAKVPEVIIMAEVLSYFVSDKEIQEINKMFADKLEKLGGEDGS